MLSAKANHRVRVDAPGRPSERQVAAETAARLLREIMHYQQCLKQIRIRDDHSYLIDAYRKEIQTRRRKLDVIPPLPEAVSNPWI